MAREKGWKEVKKSTSLLRETLKEAKSSLEARKHEQAKELFQRCLQINQETRCATSLDILSSQIGLGDCCLALKDYAGAEKSYQDCLDLLGDNPEQTEVIVSVSVKRARALEWLKQMDQAGELLERASALAQGKLAPGHLLISSTLEARAALLRKHYRKETLADQLEEAARANLAIRTGTELGDYNETILRGLEADQSSDAQGNGAKAPGKKQGRHRLLKGTGEKPPSTVRVQITRVLAVTIALALLGTGFTFLFADWFEEHQTAQENEQKQEFKAAASLAGKQFTTADKIESVRFLPKGKAEIQFADLSQHGSYKWCPDSGYKPGQAEMALNQVDSSTLVDDSGIVLYDDDAPESKLIKQANFLADTLNTYYQINSHYPESDDDLKVFQPRVLFEDPYTGKVAAPSVLYITDANIFQKRLEQAREGIQWPDCPLSCLEAAVVRDDGEKSFVIRLRDRHGKFVTSAVPSKDFVLYSHNGDATSLSGIIDAEVEERKEQIGSLRNQVVVVAASQK